MNEVFERNLAALLRTWEPVRPRPAYRAQLWRALEARLEVRHAAVRNNVTRRRWTALAAAALLLVSLGVVLGLRDRGGRASLEELVADGAVAWRTADDGAWQRHDDAGPLVADGAYLELHAPPTRGATAIGRGATLELEARGHVVREAGTLRLARGGAALESAEPWRVVTSEGLLELARGRVEARVLGGGEVEPPIAGAAPERDVVRVRLVRGAARVVASGPLTVGEVRYLQAGRLLPDGALAGAAEGPGARVGLDRPDVEDARTDGARDATTGGALRGRVRGPDGEPPERVHVWVRRETELPEIDDAELTVFEDTDGEFELDGLVPGLYIVVVEAPELAAQRLTSQAIAAGEALTLDLVLGRGRTVRGHVLDALTGAPIAGALVLPETELAHRVVDLTASDVPALPLNHARTDASGAFELEHLSLGPQSLRVSHPDHAPAWAPLFELTAGARPYELLAPIQVDAGGDVVGLVERADGIPWSDAMVLLSHVPGDRSMSIMTYAIGIADDGGVYRIPHLPQGMYIAFNLSHQPDDPSGWTDVQQVFVEAGVEARLDFLAEPVGTRLHGVVKDQAGAPLAGVAVVLAPVPLSKWTTVQTDAEGAYVFAGLEPGEYYVLASYGGQLGTMVAAASLTLEPGAPAHELDLEKPPGAMRGVVRDADGTPSGGSILFLLRRHGPEWEFHGRAMLGPSGAYAFDGLLAGEYRLVAVSDDAARGMLFHGPWTQTDEALEHDLELVAGGSLAILVRDARGRPAVGVSVELEDARGRELPWSIDRRTNEAGRVRVPVAAAGTWRVRAASDAGVAGDEVLVRVGEEERLELRLAPRDEDR